MNASYNAAGQLTSESKTRPALLGSSTTSTGYTYDANGNRTKSQTGLSSTTYKYTDDNKVAEVNQTGRKVTTGYDGLGRSLTSTTSSLLILGSTTTQVWDGYDVVQQSTGSATTTLVRDVTGDVAIQTTPGLLGTSTQWGLTDRLGSTIAQASGSRVGQLAKYSDWGIPTFTSVGFTSRTGYTGELSDTTAGLNHYYARSYEPTSASWLTADPYRGTMTNPGSMARYAYVEGNPATYDDLYGYAGRNQLETRQMGGGKTLVKSTHGGGPVTPSGNTGAKPNRHGPTCGVAGRPSCGGFSLGGAVFDIVLGPLVGFTRALGSTVLAAWDFSPLNLAGQALFLGPAAAVSTLQRQGMGFVALGQDPLRAPIRAVGEAFGGTQWANSPGQAAGTAAFTIATMGAGGAGIASKATAAAKEAAGAATTRFGPTLSGPLSDSVASTFRGGSYTARTTAEPTTLYRVSGGDANPIGSYWTSIRPTGPLQSQLDSALNPDWGNTATNVTTITVPPGVRVYEGFAGPQALQGGGQIMGGGPQVYIPHVDPAWVAK